MMDLPCRAGGTDVAEPHSNSTVASRSVPVPARASATAGPPSSVRVEGVSKLFQTPGGTLTALDGIDLDVADGEFVALVGPSGCGKSTLLNIAGGLMSPSAGSVTVGGERLEGPRRDIGMMFQRPVLFPWRTVLENVLLPAEVFRLDRTEYRRRALEVLALTGLEEFAGSYPYQLSGGMQQRAALGRVLLCEPALLLMDEPFGALDEFTREALNIELMRISAAGRKTVLFVTHNINEAVFLADRVVAMTPRPGRVARVVDVPFPRPRDRGVMREPGFAEAVFAVRDLLGVAR